MPIISDILLFQDDSAASANACRYADALANECESHIVGLMFGLYPSTSSVGYMDSAMDVWAGLRLEALDRASRLQDALKLRFEHARQAVELRRCDLLAEEAAHCFATHARCASVSILGWPAGDDRGFERGLLEGSLFYSGRPILIIPESWSVYGPPKRVLIAWNGSKEGARAVADALPLLRLAQTVRVMVVDDRRNSMGEDKDPGADIALHLTREGVNVEVRQAPSFARPAWEVVLEEAGYFGAGLVVSGGYGHSRLGEWAFGGFTHDILRAATVPLLLSH